MHVTFTSQAEISSGHLFKAERPKPLAFLFIHGWTGHQNLIAARALCDHGFTCLTYDMRGVGDSAGDFDSLTRADYLEDACAAYDYLREQVGPDTPIGVAGSSFGSYLAALLTRKRTVKCL